MHFSNQSFSAFVAFALAANLFVDASDQVSDVKSNQIWIVSLYAKLVLVPKISTIIVVAVDMTGPSASQSCQRGESGGFQDTRYSIVS